jgi:amidase
MAELIDASAVELAGLIRRGDASATEVVEAHLRRIEEADGDVNAVVQVDGERALAAAADPPDGPLRGVPFTVKDNLSAAGIEMAIGSPERVGVVASSDATVVARMRAAGAILIGKTNCPEYGGGIETDNAVYGRTNNPLDLSRTPGGSSGGEAAAIAARMSPCGFGTDSGASARLPAHFCGLAAIKPTAGLVPVTGVLDDLGQIGSLSDPRTQVSPIARSVADVALLLRVIAGPDGRDGGVAPVALGEPEGRLRVAVFADGAEPETVAVVERAAEALREAGATVAEAAPPSRGHALTIEVWRSYGGGMDALELYRLLRRWDAFRTEMLAFMERFDVLLTPVFPEPARRHGDMNRPGEIDPTGFTTPHSLTGAPAATVRCGTSATGLPIGVQLVARPWRDDVALAAALQLERALGGYRPPTSSRSFSAESSA